MGKAGPLIVFGLTLVAGGVYWAVWDGCRSYLDNILIQDVYYELMYWGFRAIPVILLIVSIMCLISAGVSGRREVIEY